MQASIIAAMALNAAQGSHEKERIRVEDSYNLYDTPRKYDLIMKISDEMEAKEYMKKICVEEYVSKFGFNKMVGSNENIEYEMKVPIIDFEFKTIFFATEHGRVVRNILILKNELNEYIPIGAVRGCWKKDNFVELNIRVPIEEVQDINIRIKIQFSDKTKEDLLFRDIDKGFHMASRITL